MSLAEGTFALLAALRKAGCTFSRSTSKGGSSIVVYLDFDDWRRARASMAPDAFIPTGGSSSEFSVNGVRFRHRSPWAGRVDARKEGA